MSKRLFVSLLVSFIVLFLFWLGGFDFNERGYTAFCAGVSALFGFAMAYSYPGWHKD